MKRVITLHFGPDSFEIRPLTLGQVEEIDGFVNDKILAENSTRHGMAIVGAALARDHAEVGVAALESTIEELAANTAAVLRLGGFLQEATPAGETPAAARHAPAGRKSKAV